jgi:predicted ArsR family transcriptional regulator
MEATGRGIGRELAASGAGADGPPTESGVEDFGRALTWLGFQPHTKPEPAAEPPVEGIPLPTAEPDEKSVTFVLGNCPYRQAVQENQPAICTLHKGILTGLLDMLEPDAAMTGFHPRNPHTAGCTVDLLLKKRAAKDEAA